MAVPLFELMVIKGFVLSVYATIKGIRADRAEKRLTIGGVLKGESVPGPTDSGSETRYLLTDGTRDRPPIE
jgi:hypothetical protein